MNVHRLAWFVLGVPLALAAGCGKNPRYCDEMTECGNPTYVCDFGGVCPESEGLTNSCIPPEAICWDAGGATVDAPSGSPDAASDALGGDADDVPPIVVSTVPLDNAVGVEPDATAQATFSEDMNPATIDESSFEVTRGGTPITGAVTYAAATQRATFTADARLALLGSYQATISTAATDANGVALASDHVWDFTVRDGAWGTSPLIETDNAGTAYPPEVGIDSLGNAIAVWYQSDGSGNNVWANRYVAGVGWGTAGLIEAGSGEAGNADVGVDASGNAVAVWQQSDGTRYNIWANRYVVGSGWETAALIEVDNTAPAILPQVAVDPAGNAIALWEHGNNIWANRYVAGVGWGSAAAIESDANAADDPEVGVDSGGNGIAVWRQSDGTNTNAWANRYVVGSGWGTAEMIETNNAGAVFYPQVAVHTTGNAIAVWSQSDGTRENIWANRFVVGSGWGTAELIETNNLGHARRPQVAMDSSDRATVIWQQSDGARDNIWANRHVPGPGWDTAATIESDDGDAILPQVDVDPAGNATTVWTQSANVWSNRYVLGPGWGSAALIETNPNNAANVQVAVASAGEAVAVWLHNDGTRNNVRANAFR